MTEQPRRPYNRRRKPPEYWVALIEYDTEIVVREYPGCSTKRQAEDVEAVINNNINHKQYYTEVFVDHEEDTYAA